ncbi:MAG: MBL fold metallo-hydrolase [Myxococcota bacterium]
MASAEPAVTVRWLGVAGFAIESGDTALLHDPYLSRPGLWRTALFRYRPNPAVLGPLLAAGSPAPELARARLILIGHSHFDHLGDAPWIAQRSGASLAGSATSVAIARGYGLAAEQTQQLAPGARVEVGPFAIRVVESRHAAVLLGRVPLPGQLEEPPDGPIHALSFVLGDARGYLVEHRPTGLRLFLLSSAGVHPPALEGLRKEGVSVDVLLAAVQGRDAEYAATLVTSLRPRVVVPHHFESFFRPIDDPRASEPSDPADLAAFEQEIRAAAEAAGAPVEVRYLDLFGTLTLRAP